MRNKIIFLISILSAGFLSVFASPYPDGLEKVAEDKEFIDSGYILISGVIPDYIMPGISYEPLATSLAGIFGTITIFYLIILIGRLLIRFKKYEKDSISRFNS